MVGAALAASAVPDAVAVADVAGIGVWSLVRRCAAGVAVVAADEQVVQPCAWHAGAHAAVLRGALDAAATAAPAAAAHGVAAAVGRAGDDDAGSDGGAAVAARASFLPPPLSSSSARAAALVDGGHAGARRGGGRARAVSAFALVAGDGIVLAGQQRALLVLPPAPPARAAAFEGAVDLALAAAAGTTGATDGDNRCSDSAVADLVALAIAARRGYAACRLCDG